MIIKIGTRKSKLALIQTDLVIREIATHFPHINCEIIPITTTGDVITDRALYDIGGKALFLKEIEQQLIEQKIDIAVHSLKDVPGEMPEGLVIAAVLEREDARDVFVSFKHKSILELPKNAIVGSTSVRRKLYLQKIRPDLQVVVFRGNIDTRLKKLAAGAVDASILAAAGLNRIKAFNSEYCHLIEPELMLPAVGQGVIGIEIRKGDAPMQNICDAINHKPTWQLIQIEREFLKYLEADCKTPVAAYAYLQGDDIKTDFMLADNEGLNMDFHSELCSVDDAAKRGRKVAELMLARQAQYHK
jgi:hydroxymethylbilane synthase